jgi:hypothetical protein
MTRVSTAVLLATLLAAAAPSAQQAPAFGAGTHTVPVYASVVDATGRLVTGLSRDDFIVFDEGRPQDLTVFTGDVQPITIVIMLDLSGSVAPLFEHVRAAAEQFVAQLGDDDRARIGSFSNAVRIEPMTFTSDRNALVRILHEDLQAPGPTPLWNAAAAAMTALRPEAGRRVVLMFTDGYDNPLNYGARVSQRDIRERARTEETMLYAIGLAIECRPGPSESATRALSSGLPLFQGRGGGGGGRGGGGGGGGTGGRGGAGRGGPAPRMPGRIGGGGIPRIPFPFPIPPMFPRPPGIDVPRGGDPFGGKPILLGQPDTPCSTTEPDLGREVAIDSGGGYSGCSTDELAPPRGSPTNSSPVSAASRLA